MVKFTSIILFIGFLVPGLLGAQNVSFTATVKPQMVVAGESFEIIFTLENARGKNFKPPGFGPFQILGGPNQSVQTQIINGSFSQTLEYSYILRATKPGKYTIGSAIIQANGKWLKTNTVTLEIKGQASAPQISSSPKFGGKEGTTDFFLKVIPSKLKAYIGEQVIVDYYLYTRRSIQDHNFITDPNCKNAYTQIIQFDPYTTTKDEVVNGRPYKSRLLRRLAIFPQEEGEVKIEPAELEVEFVDEVQNFPFPGMMRPQDVEVKRYSTKEITIQARALPTPIPEDFIGAVGNFSLNFGVSEKEVTTDDAVSVILTIEGDGDIKRIQSPELKFPPEFEVYDPKTKEEVTDQVNGKLYSKKTLEYLLIPKKAGTFYLNPTASYFDLSTGRYQTKSLSNAEIKVTQGNAKSGANADKLKENEDDSSKDILGSLKTILVAISAVVIFGTLLVLLFMRFRKKRPVKKAYIPTATVVQPQKPVIKDPLGGLENYIENGDSTGFYRSLNKSLKSWLAVQLDLDSQDAHLDIILQTLKDKNYNEHVVDLAKHIFDTCDMVLYAGMDKSFLIPRIMDEVREFKQSIISTT